MTPSCSSVHVKVVLAHGVHRRRQVGEASEAPAYRCASGQLREVDVEPDGRRVREVPRRPAGTRDTAEVDTGDLPGAQQPSGPPRIQRNVERPREIVSSPEGQDAERVLGAGQATGHRPDGAVTAGRDHQAWLPVRRTQQLGQSIQVLDLELLRHNELRACRGRDAHARACGCGPREGSSPGRQAMAGWRTIAKYCLRTRRAFVGQHDCDTSPDDGVSGHHTFCVIRRPGRDPTSSRASQPTVRAATIIWNA